MDTKDLIPDAKYGAMPDNFEVKVKFKNGIYTIIYIEYFENADEDMVEYTMAYLDDVFYPVRETNPNDKIVIKKLEGKNDAISIMIETDNSAMYMLGLSGEFFTQGIMHYLKSSGRNDTDDVIDVIMTHETEIYKQFLKIPMMPDHDIPEYRKEHD